MPNRYFITLFAFLLCAAILSAQPQIEHIQHLSYKEGLSDRAAWHITQDSKGFVWIATDNGLNRYTGSSFEIYDNNAYSKHPIHENSIHEIEEIAGGMLVLLNHRKKHFCEIIELDNFANRVVELNQTNGISGTFKSVFLEKMGNVYALAEDQDGFLIYEMNAQFGFEKIGSFTFSGKKKAGETRFIKTKSGQFWIMDSQNGLLCYSPKSKSTKHFRVEEITQMTTATEASYSTSVLHEDVAGRVWMAFPFRNGLFQILPSKDQLTLANGFPQQELYNKIWEDQQGHLFIGTFLSFGKLHRLFFLSENALPVDAVNLLEIDEKINHISGQDFTKSLFLSTFVGIYNIKMKDRPIRWLLADRQLADGDWDDGISIRSITGDGEGHIYIARELKAWYKYNLATQQLDPIILNDEDGNPIRLWCNSNVVYDPAGYLWGGSCADDRSGMLHRYELKNGTTKTFPIPNKSIKHILRLETGELVLACGADDADGVLLFFDPKTEQLSSYSDADGNNPLLHKKPQFILRDKDGIFWVGTDEGLVQIDRETRTSKLFNSSNSHLTNDNILAIHEAPNGDLLLGTYGGLNILHPNNGEAEHYNIGQGLCNNTVCGILPDGAGNYFISTFYGLSFFDASQKLFSNFYQEKGLTFNEFNRLAFYKDEEENYYFGTLNGINIFQKNDLLKTAEQPAPLQWVRITKFTDEGDQEVWDKEFSALKKIKLRQGDDYLQFEVALPYYLQPGQNQYAAKLVGLDTSWRLLHHQTVFKLNRPPPGQYEFRVKAAPAQGHWLPEELSVDIQVKQAIYQRPWFQVVLPVVILLLSYLASLWNIERIRKQQEQQTHINKKFAELELQALQSQMNPHFVFNALGAIQYFIQKNDAEAADSYLAKFAKLMRLFLESSKNKYIPLSEEIKLLSLYVELEQMRYENKFEVEMIVDDNIDVHSRELPSILIQPFVENAINHGLFNKKENGLLTIEFEEDGQGMLICTIKDDGVGRAKADLMKQQSNRTHKSRGMQIVRERLEVLQHVDELSIIVTVEDHFPEKEDRGTIVKIKIPDPD